MEEAVKTLTSLGIAPVMTRGTVQLQREIGSLRLGQLAGGVSGKIDQINCWKADAA
jgi:hypothetical protein